MDLAAFMNDAATGSWADEMEDMPLAPAPKAQESGPKRGEPGYLDSVPDRASRLGGGGYGASAGGGPPREELPLPERPPYNAFVGNLTFEVTEGDLTDFFTGADLVSVRLINGPDGRPKGFGYVEFKTLDGLKDGLSKSGLQFQGRTIRVSVADAPKTGGFGGGGRDSGGRDGGFGGPSMAEEASQWRRSGPLPAREPPAGGAGGRSYGGGGGGGNRFDDGPGGGSGGGFSDMADRDWGAARGSRFTPSAPSEPRRGSGAAGAMDGGPAPIPRDINDMPSDWRANRPARPDPPAAPASSERQSSGGPRAGGAGGFIEREVGLSGPAATEETWSRGSKFAPSPAAAPTAAAGGAPGAPVARPEIEEKSDWRSSKKPSVQASEASRECGPSSALFSPNPRSLISDNPPFCLVASASATPSPPPQRRQLKLAPRSASGAAADSSSATSTPPASAGSKASPFGAARPIDTAAKEAEAEERLKQRQEAERAEREAKAKAAAEQREKDKAEAASASSGAAATTAGGKDQQSRRPSGGPPPIRGGHALRGARGGATGGAAAPNVHPSRLAAQQQADKAARDAKKEREREAAAAAAVTDEDGFATVTASRKAQLQREQQAAQEKAAKEAEQKRQKEKQGFSFAAAARAQGLEGFVEGEDEGEEEQEQDKGDKAVDEATKGVQEVSV